MMKKDLTSILRNFSKTLGDLQQYVKGQSAAIEENDTEIALLQEQQKALTADRDRAQRVIGNLERLLETA
jgi:hypothetical protein